MGGKPVPEAILTVPCPFAAWCIGFAALTSSALSQDDLSRNSQPWASDDVSDWLEAVIPHGRPATRNALVVAALLVKPAFRHDAEPDSSLTG